MDVVNVISFISGAIVAFLAGMGGATFIIFRKWSRYMTDRVEWTEFDIQLMYRLHRMQPPAEMRQNLIDEMNSRETRHD